jgi:hypothetical protein
MAALTVFIYNQERQALSNEVEKRGTAIAKNLANNAAEAMTTNEELTLFVLAKQAVQDPMTGHEGGENFWGGIIDDIKDEINGAVKNSSTIKNEGILDAIVVNRGIIVSASDVRKKGENYILPAGIKPLSSGEDVLVQ